MRVRNRIGVLILLLAAGLVLLWWLADDRRGTVWAIAAIRRTFPDVRQVSPAAVEPRLVLIDARSEAEFVMSHLPKARHMDVETVTLEQIRALDPKQRYLVYCSAGYRSCQLARRFREAGISEVYNLEGGIFAWANEGHPVYRDGRPVSEVHPYHALFSRLLKPELRPHGR